MALDEQAGTISYTEMIYVMPNDPKRLYEAFRKDFPVEGGTFTASAKGDVLELKPVGGAPPLTLKLDPGAGEWQSKWWGAFIRGDKTSRAWACPHEDALELCVAFKPGAADADTRAAGTLAGGGWSAIDAPAGVTAKVLRSADGKWTAALTWERDGIPAESEPGGSLAVRGKLIVAKTEALDLAKRVRWAQMDWEHATPYRAPVDDAR
jgi:hypothetical protein